MKKNRQDHIQQPPIQIITLTGFVLGGGMLAYTLLNPGFSWVRLLILLAAFLLVFLGLWLAKAYPKFSSVTQNRIHRGLNISEKIILVAGSIIITFLILEMGYRLAIRYLGENIRNNLAGKPFVVDSRAVYQDAPFDYDAYITFIGEHYHHDYVNREGYYISPDFESKDFNVVDGFRVTTDQPEQFEHRIYIFGGSTVFSIETPDAYTIPSLLQKELAEAGLDSYSVESRGIPGGYSREELAALQDMEIQPGDIVIFYDGINEIFRYLMDRSPRRYDSLIYYMKKSLLLTDFVIPRLPLKRFENQAAYEQEIYQGYIDHLTQAAQIVRDQGGVFVHILQPSLYSTPHRSEREQKILENIRALYPGWVEAYQIGYQVLTRVHHELAAQGLPSYDFQDTLDGENRTLEIFIDDLHLNHTGNHMIAEQLLTTLQENLIIQSEP
jgi:lysophospholipase L1-like esterase